MSDKKQAHPTANPVKDPDEWVTGEEPMTGPQRSYLGTLAQEAGEAVPEDLTKAEASKKIEELQQETGRGMDAGKAKRGSKKSTSRRSGPLRGKTGPGGNS